MSRVAQSTIQVLDESALTRRYWLFLSVVMLTAIIELFDVFIISYLVSVIAPKWSLTIGQVSLVLAAAGIGAIVGALSNGWLADRFGRKGVLISNTALFSIASGCVALLPNGAWLLFAFLRFAVGFGVAGLTASGIPLIVEFTPTRYRTSVTSFAFSLGPIGILIASAAAATLLPSIGWRGLAALGAIPLLLVPIMVTVVPESVRWLVSRGKSERAVRSLSSMFGRQSVHVGTEINKSAVASPVGGYRKLYRYQKPFWLVTTVWFFATTASYGPILWGPIILSQLRHIDPQQAAKSFVLVSIAGIIGRLLFSVFPAKIGRVRAGQVMGYGSAAFLLCAGIFHAITFAGTPAFLVFLAIAAIFYDGGFANAFPQASEMFPVSLASRGVALAQAASGVGRIAAPACLAIIAGSGKLVTSKTIELAVLPGFTFLAACGAVVGLMYTLLPLETNGRRLKLSDDDRTDELPEYPIVAAAREG